MKNKDIQLIEAYFTKGDFKGAKTGVLKFHKKGRLTLSQRFHLSIWYSRLGKVKESLQVLGPEILDKSRLSNPDIFMLQLRLAYLLNFLGAIQSAQRIYQRLDEFFTHLKLKPDQQVIFMRYRAVAHLTRYEYAQALKFYDQLLKKTAPENSYQMGIIYLGYLDCLSGLGKNKEAVELAQKYWEKIPVQEEYLKALYAFSVGEYWFKEGCNQEAKQFFNQAAQLLAHKKNVDAALLAKWQAAFYLSQGQLLQAQTQINLACKLLSQNRLNPTAYLEAFFWQIQLNTDWLQNERGRFLNTYPLVSPCSVLTGRRMLAQEQLPAWIEKKMDEVGVTSNLDYWLISPLTTQALNKQNWQISKHVLEEHLDLVYGFKYSNQGYQLLAPLIHKALLALVGAGSLGINFWALGDWVYGQVWDQPESLQFKIKELLKRIRNMGFKIMFKGQHLKMKLPGFAILMANDSRPHPLWEHFKMGHPQFTARELALFYRVSQSTALRLIEEWGAVVQKMGQGRGVCYCFVG